MIFIFVIKMSKTYIKSMLLPFCQKMHNFYSSHAELLVCTMCVDKLQKNTLGFNMNKIRSLSIHQYAIQKEIINKLLGIGLS